MKIPIQCLLALLLAPACLSAAPVVNADSLILKEITDSIGGPNRVRMQGDRIVYLSIFYNAQRGPIPPALGGLDSLRHLFMAITQVTSLPREIGKLRRMDTINISTSRIGPTIPEEIGDLAGLKYLVVADCKLEALPVSLMKLQKLEHVNFSRNKICRVDDSLRQWLLTRWPKALEAQDTSGCATTSIGRLGGTKGGQTIRRVYLPGLERQNLNSLVPKRSPTFYTPLGRLIQE